jgi:hypothetical protein
MADDSNYTYENCHFAWLGKETAYRTNAHGLDTANEAGDTAYYLPIKPTMMPRISHFKTYQMTHGFGSRDENQLTIAELPAGTVSLSGDLYDLGMLYFMVKGCTTTDDSPGAGYYTHVYASSTAGTKAATFQFIEKLVNDDSDNTEIWLFVGCYVKSWSITIVEKQKVTCALEIGFARKIAGVDLTTWPSLPAKTPFYADQTVVTYARGGTAYAGSADSVTITWDDGVIPIKGLAAYIGMITLGPRKIGLNMLWTPTQKDDVIHEESDLPATTQDLDVTLKISRDTTYDYIQFAFEKLFNIMPDGGAYNHENWILNRQKQFKLKPAALESGGKVTITEVNQYDDDRYET